MKEKKQRKVFDSMLNLAKVRVDSRYPGAGTNQWIARANNPTLKQTCRACHGQKTTAPGGNQRKRRVCGKCFGRGYKLVGKYAVRGTWFESQGLNPEPLALHLPHTQ